MTNDFLVAGAGIVVVLPIVGVLKRCIDVCNDLDVIELLRKVNVDEGPNLVEDV